VTTDITPENVERMLEGVTEGPWRSDSAFCRDNQARRVALPDRFGVPSATIAECVENWHEAEEYNEPRVSWKEAEANARFIAYARQAVPALAAERDALAVRLAEVEAERDEERIQAMYERAFKDEARAETDEAEARAKAARWNVDESGNLIRLCRGEHPKAEACEGHEELFVPIARAEAAEARESKLIAELSELRGDYYSAKERLAEYVRDTMQASEP
jgi:hypothetical protein